MQVIEPILVTGYAQTSDGSSFQRTEIDFNLGYLEGVLILMALLEHSIAEGYYEQMTAASRAAISGLSIDPNVTWNAREQLWTEPDIIAAHASGAGIQKDTTYGVGYGMATQPNRVFDFRPDGIAVARNVAFLQVANYNGLVCAGKIWYKRVRFTESELVSLVAHRR